ncbi:type II toxin-antitoxin system VapB family antitoxin [Methylobacterium sp. ARG-1]|uniref:type II toxin-antitoxin system VapB family antitoxin n=1 Tax=Methylobacterium sp. ARG-1 TaxID=1692501 RepID=UPI0009E81405|nr:type II toxin-antitoxin system VapB family antitoxin [Methylobacterium sp. ARG-1]
MRTPIDLVDKLVADAQRYSGISERTEIPREALRALIHREASRRSSRSSVTAASAFIRS